MHADTCRVLAHRCWQHACRCSMIPMPPADAGHKGIMCERLACCIFSAWETAMSIKSLQHVQKRHLAFACHADACAICNRRACSSRRRSTSAAGRRWLQSSSYCRCELSFCLLICNMATGQTSCSSASADKTFGQECSATGMNCFGCIISWGFHCDGLQGPMVKPYM